MFIQSCFKPLIVLLNVVIDFILCNDRVIQLFKFQSDYK